MDISSEFESVPIMGTKQFSWVFIVDWAIAVLTTLFVIFFFNRLVGTVLSSIFRWYLWRRYRVRIKVQSIQLSLLGGRLFFKNLSYVGQNEIITALQGNFTWRYWLHSKRWSKLKAEQEGNERLSDESLPARLAMQVDGLEWFIFNRSAVYDSLFDYVTAKRNETEGEGDASDLSYSSVNHKSTKESSDVTAESNDGAAASATGGDSTAATPPSTAKVGLFESLFLGLLPFQIRCTKGAVVIGNKTTPSVLVYSFTSGKASVDVGSSKSAFDKYKMIYHLHAIKPLLEMRPNIDYAGPRKDFQKNQQPTNTKKNKVLTKAQHALDVFIKLLSSGRGSNHSDSAPWEQKSQWKGLSRYMSNEGNSAGYNDTTTSSDMMNELVEEYGKASTLVDATEGSFTYFYDIAGKVPANHQHHLPGKDDGQDIGNGGSPPEFGINLSFVNATVHYGPWADRQRIPVQSMLFPRYCADATPEDRLSPGQDRKYTVMKLLIEFQGDSIIRVPMREFSKNAEFFAKYKENPNANSLRPFGWLELKFKEMSTISFNASLTSTTNGNFNTFRADFRQPELRSSVNHGLLFSADSHLLSAQVHYPLQWNGLQHWTFNNTSTGLRTFFLREHVTLLTDLVKDFGSGAPTPYDLYTPSRYYLNWTIEGFAIFLNVNDLNIINNPSDPDDNTFVSLYGDDLQVNVEIPLEQIETTSNQVEFEIKTSKFDLGVEAPPWHTLRSFLESNRLGRAYHFDLNGQYTYHAKTSHDKTDTLVLNIDGSDVTLMCYGFIIKYLMKIRENYFGESSHFQTLEEYSQKTDAKQPEYLYHRSDNDLDVLLYTYVKGGTIVLPANLYSAQSHVRLDFASFDTDVRFTNYYMDLQTNISPIKGRFTRRMDPDMILDLAHMAKEYEPELFIDGVIIHGHRLFGLPPTEPTYFCKWDFDIGDIMINGSFSTAQALRRSLLFIGYSFADPENSLVLSPPDLFDVTYLSLKVASVKVHLHTESCSLELVASPIDLSMNDLANERYSKRVTIQIPLGRLAILGKSTDKEREPPVLAAFKTSFMATNFVQKRGFTTFYEKQQEHISTHDGPFERCPFLLDSKHRYGPMKGENHLHPSISLPSVPPPLTHQTTRIIDPGLSTFENNGSMSDLSSMSKQSRDTNSSSAASSVEEPGNKVPETAPHTASHIASQNESNSYLPPCEWHQLEKAGVEFQHANEGFELSPTTHYSSEETIAPRAEVDPAIEYDNFVIQLGTVEGYVGPLALAAAHSIIEESQHRDTQDVLDKLHVDVLKKIHYIKHGKPETINLRLMVPSIELKYGSIQDASEIHSLAENERSHIYVSCNDINLAFRKSLKKQPQSIGEYMQHDEEPSRKIVYFDVNNVAIGVRRGRSDAAEVSTAQDYNPMILQLENLEFWHHEEESNVASLRVRSIDALISCNDVDWLGGYLDKTARQANQLNESQGMSIVDRQERAAFVVYELALAGERFGILHDPPVLTKPAYIIRSPQHLRTASSWKVLIRLRHLFQSVPESWRLSLNSQVEQQHWTLPEDIKSKVIDIFMNWRSWELTDMARSYFFRHVFIEVSLKETIIASNTKTLFDFESVGVRLQYKDDEDFLLFDYTQMLFNWHKEREAESEEPILNVDAELTLANIRTRVSYNILDVYDAVEKHVPKKKQAETETQTPGSEKLSELLPALNVNFTTIISNASAGLALPSVTLQVDSRDFKLTSLLKYLSFKDDVGASLVMEVENMRLAVQERERTVVSQVYTNTKGSLSFYGPLFDCSKYIMLSVQQSRFTLNYDMIKLMNLLERVVTVDYKLYERIQSNGPHNNEVTKLSSEPSKPFYVGPVFIKLEQIAGHAEFNLMESLHIRYHVGMSRMDFRQVDKYSCCIQFSMKNQRLETKSSAHDGNRLLMVKINDTQSLGRLELPEVTGGLGVAEILVNVDEIENLADSVTGLTKHVMYESLHDEISDFQKKLPDFLSAVGQLNQGKVDPVPKPSSSLAEKFALNLNFTVDRAMTVGSLADDSIVLEGNGITLRFKSFEVSETGEIFRRPLAGDLSTDDFKTVVVGNDLAHSYTKLLSLQATAQFQERENKDEKDRINIMSDFLHVHLNPESLVKVFKIVRAVQKEMVIPARYHQQQHQSSAEKVTPFPYSHHIKRFADRSIAAIKLNDVAVAWLFTNQPSKRGSTPGILFGYESFEVSTTSFKARTVLTGVYLTPAAPDTVFLENKCSGHSANTAYLSNIELMIFYELTKPNPTLNLRLVGDSLKITILPSIVALVSKGIDSFVKTAGTLEALLPENTESAQDEQPVTDSGQQLRLPFSWHLTVIFEAANINVWDEAEYYRNLHLQTELEDSNSTFNPAVLLETPSVNAELMYELKDNANDQFKTQVLISSSSNTIYPKAVPVVVDIYQSVKSVMQKSHNQKNSKGLERRYSIGSSSSNPQSATALFSGLDVYIGVRYLRQEITLSCAPTAKVAATLSHDQCVFNMNTCDSPQTSRFFCGTGRLRNLRISLQHIYSREVSGYVAMDDLMIFAAKNNINTSDAFDAVMVTGKLSDITVDVNLKQMQDLELFLDIWRPSGVLTAVSPTPLVETKPIDLVPEDEAGIVMKYRRATTTVAIPWNVDISITNIQGLIDMGQSVGKVSVALDRIWMSSQKSSNWEQHMMLGLDNISLNSEGRLGGTLQLRKLQMKTAIMWEDVDDHSEFNVPLVQALVGLETLELKTSLDYHLFAAVCVRKLHLSMSNQHDIKKILGDRLLVIGDCDVLNVYFTGLAASNILDIYYTVVRMRNESHASYDAILKDSKAAAGENSNSKEEAKKKRADPTLSNVIAKLRTVLDIRISTCNLYIFPNSMTDSVVFTIAVDGANARYGQEQQDDKFLESNLEMHMEQFKIALATMRRSFPDEDVNQIKVETLVDYVTECAKGGSIIHVPRFDIRMNTWQEFGKSVVEYTYESSFGGRVDVGWNLGSVNFIREMWENHARAYTTRREAYTMKESANMLGKVNIDENLKDVTLNAAYSYVPRSPPIIATPQLRDMGEATPPIEWIGLHRQRFPGLTHQVVILSLQELAHEVELLYRQVLGHS